MTRSPARLLPFAAIAILSAFPAMGATASVIAHHTLSVSLDPAAGALAGVDRIRLDSTGPRTFQLSPGFVVDRVTVDGRPIDVDPAAGRWPLDGEPGRHTVVVEYRGTIERGGGDEGRAGRLLDETGTFLSGAGWYPFFGDGLLSYDVTVDLPAGQVAVVPGRIVSEESGAERNRARFVSEGPIDDIALFAGPYRVTERRHGGIGLRTYLHAEVADLADLYLTRVAEYLDFYRQWIGDYPYSSFSVVSGPPPVGLGFPGLTYVGTRVLRLPFLPETSLGHEVLHCWWGNAVLADTSRGNWAEGLTTFMADYTFAERKGEAEARDMRLRWLREYAVLPPSADRALDTFRSRRHTASQVVGYHKAAMVFLMLRDEIGRAAFDRGLRSFWKERRFRSASWSDLRAAFAKASERSLDRFFAQWIERSGAPRLAVARAAAESAKGAFSVAFALTQDEPVYRLSVPVEIETETGTIAEDVVLDEAERTFRVGSGAPPRGLGVDPDLRLFRRLDPAEVPPILRSVAFDPTAAAVVVGADEAARAAARDVAVRFFEREPRFLDRNGSMGSGPLLLVGAAPGVASFLEERGLPPEPERLAGRGSVRAWAMTGPDGRPLAVVSGSGAAALAEIARRLPHYGAESFVVFDAGRVVDRGLWPITQSPLHVELAP